ncbi:hypothetical protein jhhlp_000234 [Lomentospora prolificans]|uniref:Uncharacterized protein n=1 Tax=Lomentospora prolificans TaxID=41688 RepID=A0A2N3NKD8_9PEZI|nr:hypothetical protein jhhlp_000234 [Lomentospora prolificans]
MQTVPSLVGTGTAVAAAATGLVFSQPTDSHSITNRPATNKRKSTLDREGPEYAYPGVSSPSRPGTSSCSPASAAEDKGYGTLPHHFSLPGATSNGARPRPPSTLSTSKQGHFRRLSLNRPGDYSTYPTEDPRDSISSNGSWIKRFSIRPSSVRSSIGPDTHSLTFSYGSSAPILPSDIVPPLPPNKLVKRPPPPAHANYSDPQSRRRAKTHLPSLRRPATSHQRSATLRQTRQDNGLASPVYSPRRFSFDRKLPGPDLTSTVDQDYIVPQPTPTLSRWTSFFHSRAIKIGVKAISSRSNDGGPATLVKRISPNINAQKPVYLTQSSAISSYTAQSQVPGRVEEEPQIAAGDSNAVTADSSSSSPEDTPSKRARRSISMTFSSPGNWIMRSGSIRRPKRGSESSKAGGKRHVSAPVAAQPGQHEKSPARANNRSKTTDDVVEPSKQALAQSRNRNTSSPLPPLSRLSSFNIDLAKLGAASGAPSPEGGAPQTVRPHQPSGSSQASSSMAPPGLSRNHRSPTLTSSDFDGRDFTSGDDDDTDFKSDTIFDSIRTVASGRMRSVETPLESMFDESPPSTAGHTKAKRLSIQEVLIRNWDGDHDRIMEEDDETALTPVRLTHNIDRLHEPATIIKDDGFAPAGNTNHYSLPNKDFGRLSLDDEEEDWTKDDYMDQDDLLVNCLSPPSKNNVVNMRNINPNLRVALASISGNRYSETRNSSATERPLSTLFDWSEPVVHDKQEGEGQSQRPKTVHGKQDIDIRGGRAATRKGPTAAHVRSQSVPVVHDQPENQKTPAPKFGTWGLGSKGVSEDWGDDFEFEESPAEMTTGKDSCRSFVVPEPIQASQSSVKAHSGQIRELSLLVNDLKRLCRHGRDMDMLGGSQASLWKEAEGIIALASPDEDEPMEGAQTVTSSPPAEVSSNMGDKFNDDGFDAASLDFSDINMSKTTVVRSRHSIRRRSVIPDDDIFGGAWPPSDDGPVSDRPRTPENKVTRGGDDVSGIVRTVMDAMQQRSVSTPVHGQVNNKVHFDTASLKALVKRAGDLRDALSDLVRKADPIAPSPARTPRHDGSPAFTRVFNEPPSSPSRRLPHSRSNNSVLSRTSMDTSSSTTMGPKRMQVMTVS